MKNWFKILLILFLIPFIYFIVTVIQTVIGMILDVGG
jgi:membrane-anchored glycerophosphoryl diester phosphodiesterase (GDPDase)